MSSIDNRVINMEFNNAEFQKRISQTTDSLAQFEKTMQMENAGKNLDTIASKFNVFGAIGFSAINKLTNIAIDSGAKIYNAVMEPLIKGGERRSQNFAQAEFQLKGLGVTGDKLKQVMDAASYAVDGTAYGLDQAAIAASSFVASTVPIEQLPTSLRAISGVAAMTGRDFGDISQIFTTVAGNGRLMATELNRIGASGVNAAAALAKYLGVTETEVRKMTSEGKINFEIFASAMDSAFGEQATKANELFSGSLANVRSALARIGEPIADGKFESLRLIFNALRPVINQLKDALLPLLEAFKEFQINAGRNVEKFLGTIDLSPLAKVIPRVLKGFQGIWDILKRIGTSFTNVISDVFPPSSVNIIDLIVRGFERFVKAITPSAEAMRVFEIVLHAVMSTIKFLWETLKQVSSVIFALIGVIVEIIGVIWDLVKPFDATESATNSAKDSITSFYDVLALLRDNVLKPVTEWLHKVRDAIADMRDGGSSGIEFIDTLYNKFIELKDKGLSGVAAMFEAVGASIRDFFTNGGFDQFLSGMTGLDIDFSGMFSGQTVLDVIKELLSGIIDLIFGLGDAIKDVVGEISTADLLGALNLGAIVGGVVIITNAFRSITGVHKAFVDSIKSFGGIFDSISGVFDQVTKNLKTMQTDVKSNIILKIAIAVGILAGSLWLIASIPADRIGRASAVAGGAIAALVLSMIAIEKVTTPAGVAKMTALGTTMVMLATSVAILAAAMKKIAEIDPDGLGRAAGIAAGAIVALTTAMLVLDKVTSGGRVLLAAGAIVVMSASLIVLANALEKFAAIDGDDLVKGGVSAAIALTGLIIAAKAINKVGPKILGSAIGIAAISGALILLATAVQKFGEIPTDQLIRGGIGIAGMLIILAGAVKLLGANPAKMISAAIGLTIMAIALKSLSDSVISMAGLDWGELAVGLTGLAGVLTGVVVAAKLMSSNMGGAITMIIVAQAISMLAGTIKQLSDIGIEKMGTALLGLAGAMTILVVAARAFQSSIAGALAMVIVAHAITVLAAAIVTLTDLDVTQVGIALMALAGGVILLVAAAKLAQGSLAGSAAIIVLAGAMVVMAFAINMLAGLDIAQVGIALLALGGAVAIFVIAAAALSAVIPGTLAFIGILLAMGVAAVLVAASVAIIVGAISLLGPALTMAAGGMGIFAEAANENLKYIGSVFAWAAAILVFGAAAIVAGVGIALLGVGVLALGTGLVLAGVGILSFALALEKLTALAGEDGIVAYLTQFMTLIPLFAAQLALGFIAVLGVIASNGQAIMNVIVTLISAFLGAIRETIPEFVETIVTVVSAIIDGLSVLVPQLIDLAVVIITAFVEAIVTLIPMLVDAGMRLIIGILDGIAANIGQVVTSATDVIIAFVDSMATNGYRIVTAAGEAVLKFINGITAYIDNNNWRFVSAGSKMFRAIIDAVSNAIERGGSDIRYAGQRIGEALLQGAMNALGIASPSKEFAKITDWSIEGLVGAVGKNLFRVEDAGDNIGDALLSSVESSIVKLEALANGELDFNPTITPVLDLSNIQDGARSIDGLLTPGVLDISSTYADASEILAAQNELEEYKASRESDGPYGDNYEYNQYITSPKAVSQAETYRNTKNLISTQKKKVEPANVK